jgi:Family of unknown function (DUF5681)
MKDKKEQIRSDAVAAEHGRVGYHHPPREHQFKKGHSGNRPGRRKGARNLLTVFKEIAQEKIRVRIAGEVHIVTWGQYVILANY